MIVGGTLATVTALIGFLQVSEPWLPASHEFVRDYINSIVTARSAARDAEMKKIDDRVTTLSLAQTDGFQKVSADAENRLAAASHDASLKFNALNLQLIETQLSLVSGQIRQTNSDLADLTLKERDLPNDSFIARRKNELNDDLRQLVISQASLECQLQTAQNLPGRC